MEIQIQHQITQENCSKSRQISHTKKKRRMLDQIQSQKHKSITTNKIIEKIIYRKTKKDRQSR